VLVTPKIRRDAGIDALVGDTEARGRALARLMVGQENDPTPRPQAPYLMLYL
jgi:hypothetical protein